MAKQAAIKIRGLRVHNLKDVDTDHVEPTAHSADVQTVMREDEARPSRDRENMLANAPHREADFLRVRSVLD